MTKAVADGPAGDKLSCRVGSQALLRFTTDALIASGMSVWNASSVADIMVEADLIGADAHGTFRLAQYTTALISGQINPQAKLTVQHRRSAVALVDGGGGMGHLAMARAVDIANDLAKASGVGWVGLRHSNHAGAIGIYAARLASQGKIGICAAVSGVNHMAPTGSAEALIGTNPLAIAIPSGKSPPVIVDIATSVTSYGKIKSAASEGKSIPVGWAIERATGEPLIDPQRIESGLLLALGGYKGAGLAIALGLLAGVLNTASFGRAIPDFAAPAPWPVNTGQFVIAIDIEAFRPFAEFASEIDDHVDVLKMSNRLPGSSDIRLPGQERASRREDRTRNGVPVSAARLAAFDILAGQLKISPLLVG